MVNELTDDLTQIKQDISHAMGIAKVVPGKIEQLVNAKKELEKKLESLKQDIESLQTHIVSLEAKNKNLQTEMEKQGQTKENVIVSIRRELDLTKDDLAKRDEELKARNERISILESQNKELAESLREKSV